MSSINNSAGVFICLVVAWAITFFIGLGGTIADIELLIGSGANAILTLLSGICIAQLNAYNLLLIGTYSTIIALALGGFLGGLISRSISGAFVIAISYMILLFAIPIAFTTITTYDPMLSIQIVLITLGATAADQAITIIVAFVAILIPAVIGGSITKPRV